MVHIHWHVWALRAVMAKSIRLQLDSSLYIWTYAHGSNFTVKARVWIFHTDFTTSTIGGRVQRNLCTFHMAPSNHRPSAYHVFKCTNCSRCCGIQHKSPQSNLETLSSHENVRCSFFCSSHITLAFKLDFLSFKPTNCLVSTGTMCTEGNTN